MPPKLVNIGLWAQALLDLPEPKRQRGRFIGKTSDECKGIADGVLRGRSQEVIDMIQNGTLNATKNTRTRMKVFSREKSPVLCYKKNKNDTNHSGIQKRDAFRNKILEKLFDIKVDDRVSWIGGRSGRGWRNTIKDNELRYPEFLCQDFEGLREKERHSISVIHDNDQIDTRRIHLFMVACKPPHIQRTASECNANINAGGVHKKSYIIALLFYTYISHDLPAQDADPPKDTLHINILCRNQNYDEMVKNETDQHYDDFDKSDFDESGKNLSPQCIPRMFLECLRDAFCRYEHLNPENVNVIIDKNEQTEAYGKFGFKDSGSHMTVSFCELFGRAVHQSQRSSDNLHDITERVPGSFMHFRFGEIEEIEGTSPLPWSEPELDYYGDGDANAVAAAEPFDFNDPLGADAVAVEAEAIEDFDWHDPYGAEAVEARAVGAEPKLIGDLGEPVWDVEEDRRRSHRAFPSQWGSLGGGPPRSLGGGWGLSPVVVHPAAEAEAVGAEAALEAGAVRQVIGGQLYLLPAGARVIGDRVFLRPGIAGPTQPLEYYSSRKRLRIP